MIRASQASPTRRSSCRWPNVGIGSLLCIFFVGCGTATYEERLDQTRKLFEYHNTLNQNLQGKWDRSDVGIAMRIPKGYTLLPAPPAPKQLDDGTVEVVEDTRQPAFLGIELPGLVEAWRLQDVGSLYVCSNHRRLAEQTGATAGGADPKSLLEDLESVLQQGLKFSIDPKEAASPGDANARFRMTIPTTNEYAVQKEFISIPISAGEIENVDPLAGQVYEFQNGPVQVAVVLIYLKSARTNPDRALKLALETIDVSAEPPRPTSQGGAGGGPAGRSGGPSF